MDEIKIWGSLSGQHPNILELYGAVKYSWTVIIFMEYMSGKSWIVIIIIVVADVDGTTFLQIIQH